MKILLKFRKMTFFVILLSLLNNLAFSMKRSNSDSDLNKKFKTSRSLTKSPSNNDFKKLSLFKSPNLDYKPEKIDILCQKIINSNVTPLELLDNMSYFLLFAQTGIDSANRNRLPKLASFLFEFKALSENNINATAIKNIDNIKFFCSVADIFKNENIKSIISFLQENIFDQKTEEAATVKICEFFNIGTKNSRSRKQRDWIVKFTHVLFALKEDGPKKDLAGFIFVSFLCKIINHYANSDTGLKDKNFSRNQYIFFMEFLGKDFQLKEYILKIISECGYDQAIRLFLKDTSSYEGLDIIVSHLLFLIKKYEKYFSKEYKWEKRILCEKNIEYLMSILESKIYSAEEKTAKFIYYQILLGLSEKEELSSYHLTFCFQEYRGLLKVVSNLAKKFNWDLSDLNYYVLVCDKHIKKIVLENKTGDINCEPQGGHIDINLPYSVSKIPETIYSRPTVVEVIEAEEVFNNPKNGVSLVNWILSKKDTESLRKGISSNEFCNAKMSTLFPSCYSKNIDKYIKSLYLLLLKSKNSLDEVEVFGAVLNKEASQDQDFKNIYIIKHPANFGCLELSCSEHKGAIYTVIIISKQNGINCINTIYPLGCYVLDLEKLDQMSGEIEINSEKTISYIDIKNKALEELNSENIITEINSNSYMQIQKMLFKDSNNKRYRFVKAINGIWVKICID
ncbi:MAG: hypothetical protein SZ59_C0001G0164 [candidate division TM6 bacterium GW2011_GWF2_28_16]|nr:MAG: hypothetical protein SZ59_C0001G0164 [candidate division TM6 bacterium GW2011_GWF2_28_16]